MAVTFDSAYHSSTGTTYWGTWHRDPRFRRPNDAYDVAVVVFPSAIPGLTPAELPEAGSLANVEPGTKFTAVGYGAQFITHKKGGQVFHYTDIRFMAVSSLRTQSRTWLRDSQNPALGNGGSCTGDSGGPNFLGAGSTRDEHPCRDDDHRRRGVPVDERRPPPRYGVGALVPGPVRQPALSQKHRHHE